MELLIILSVPVMALACGWLFGGHLEELPEYRIAEMYEWAE